MRQTLKLNALGHKLSKEFQERFDYCDHDCDCFISPNPNTTCEVCSHPGHPAQLAETPEAWHSFETTKIQDPCDHVYGFFTIFDDAGLIYTTKDLEVFLQDPSAFVEIFKYCPHCSTLLNTSKKN